MRQNYNSIIWIASYPKSGNTWIRVFLNKVLFSGNNNNLNLGRIPTFASDKYFEQYFDPKKNPVGKIKEYWGAAQDHICRTTTNINYIKTHNINASFGAHNFTSKKYVCGIIHVVRDPRDILLSIGPHFGLDTSESLEMLLNSRSYIFSDNSYPEFISDWETHYKSWKSFKGRPYLMVRYEDMIDDPVRSFRRLCTFCKIAISEKKLIDVVEDTSFSRLKKIEELEGFSESTKTQERFFRKGIVGQWKDLDQGRYIKPIEDRFYESMIDLNYTLSMKRPSPQTRQRSERTQ